VKKALDLLRGKGYIVERDGATWFTSTIFGDDKDRVVVKSDGSLTYLATDIAYHLDKYKRQFRRVIDIWGPDHHGYIPRMKAAVRALGYDASALDVLIVQLATLLREGKQVSMSTRAGEFVTQREVIDEIGGDVAKFIFLSRKLDSHLDFDLDCAKKESLENPVYYIQYAHARICSIQRYAQSFNSKLLQEPEALELMRLLRQFPMVVHQSAKNLEPNGVAVYLQNLAACFHNFYNKVRVVSDDKALTMARLVLVDCVRIVLANGLLLLGVSLPKKM
jgi:arginyl-tRNA synthetase